MVDLSAAKTSAISDPLVPDAAIRRTGIRLQPDEVGHCLASN
jgi:hypothetical protein